MDQTYFYIDGSALLAQVRRLWKKDSRFDQRRLNPLEFIRFLSFSFPDLGSAQYKRAIFYFPKGEPISEVTTDFNVDPQISSIQPNPTS